MLAESSEDDRYTKFYVNWSLKEAFTKAIGSGLGYNFRDVSQSHERFRYILILMTRRR